jgi:hypothetical protein
MRQDQSFESGTVALDRRIRTRDTRQPREELDYGR